MDINGSAFDGDGLRVDLSALERRLGHVFARPRFLRQALRHSSYVFESNRKDLVDYERMEFLGDAVLELAVSAYLYKNMLSAKEGRLTAIRAGLVNERALYKVAKSIDLGRFILLGRGEIKSGGFDKTSILSDVMEAVLGAVFLDAGFRAVVEVVNKLWVKMFKLAFKGHIIKDPKTRLQELIQEQYKVTPTYRTVKTEGPDHQRTFYVEVLCKKDILCSGAGSSKKEAEQNAAEKALEKMGYENDND